MENDDFDSALSDLFEITMIAAAGHPPHLMDRWAELSEKNDRILDELNEEKREREMKIKDILQSLDEDDDDFEESLKDLDLEDVTCTCSTSTNGVEKDVMENTLRLNELRIKELEEEVRLTKLKLEKLQKGKEPSTSMNDTEKDAETD